MSSGSLCKATVVGSLARGELRILLFPLAGEVSRGAPRDISANLVPPHLRMPNAILWVRLDRDREIVEVWDGTDSPNLAPEAGG